MTHSLPARRLILLAGSRSRGKRAAQDLIQRSALPASRVLWLAPEHSTLDLLGQERALVVIDAYTGFNPDLLGRVGGLIQAGGALLLICPELDHWAQYADPELTKIVPYPLRTESIHSPYLERFVRILRTLDGIEHYPQSDNETIPSLAVMTPEQSDAQACTADQQRALDAIIKTATGQRRRPVFIKADRGRGKSAALGLAAGRLLADQKLTDIVVTARNPAQTGSVFKHAQAVLADARLSDDGKTLQHHNGKLRYVAVDQLIEGALNCDLLIVDEASVLGVATLKTLLACYPRIAFSGTEHGYEGSGRGFSLKFKQLIHQYSRGHVDVQMHTAIRWADDDPLEVWLNRLLLLDIDPADLNPDGQTGVKDLQLDELKAWQLARDEGLLVQVFGLLIDAHYQTRPVDCRHLLDAPNARLFAAAYKGEIVGLIWLMLEGDLPGDIAGEIVVGRRRPQGHKVPQILAAHLGLEQAVTLRCARVQRIVVKPGRQAQGIGSWMLAQLEQRLLGSIDYLASSFGVDIPLLKFWCRAGFAPVRVSDRVLTSNGLHPAVLVKALEPAAQTMLAEARSLFATQFVAQLADPLKTLHPGLACELASNHNSSTPLSEQNLKAAVLFAYARRPYESSLAALAALARNALLRPAHKWGGDELARQLMVMRVLQHQAWGTCANTLGLKGRKQCVALLREAAVALLRQSQATIETDRVRAQFEIQA